MKKIIRFSKAFLPCAIGSTIIILFGVFGFFYKGINLGLDFKPGLLEQVNIVSVNKSLTVEDVQNALVSLKGAEIKQIGGDSGSGFQIRLGLVKDKSSREQGDMILHDLYDAFGKENVTETQTSYIGAQYSSSLAKSVVLLVLATFALIWLYAMIRFHWDFAFGAIIALVHDSLIMMTFIIWTQMEFTSTTIAAILTIVGYSINATVVILDRVRENMKLYPDEQQFDVILDRALSETLSRSLITTITTLFASVALYIFTTGSIRDFASALNIGLISGCYSSMYISSGFIMFVRKHTKKNPSTMKKEIEVSKA